MSGEVLICHRCSVLSGVFVLWDTYMPLAFCNFYTTLPFVSMEQCFFFFVSCNPPQQKWTTHLNSYAPSQRDWNFPLYIGFQGSVFSIPSFTLLPNSLWTEGYAFCRWKIGINWPAKSICVSPSDSFKNESCSWKPICFCGNELKVSYSTVMILCIRIWQAFSAIGNKQHRGLYQSCFLTFTSHFSIWRGFAVVFLTPVR